MNSFYHFGWFEGTATDTQKATHPPKLSAYCARLRADLLSEPINFRFHGKTALHLVYSSVTLFQRLVDVPLTEHLRKCASVVERAEVARLMATEQASFIGAEHGLARVVHQLATDDAIVNKAALIEKLEAQIDALWAFHAAFDLLLNAVIDGLQWQAPTRLCIALFTECVLPLFWRTRSPELKQLFFLSARHIDMTPNLPLPRRARRRTPHGVPERRLRCALPRRRRPSAQGVPRALRLLRRPPPTAAPPAPPVFDVTTFHAELNDIADALPVVREPPGLPRDTTALFAPRFLPLNPHVYLPLHEPSVAVDRFTRLIAYLARFLAGRTGFLPFFADGRLVDIFNDRTVLSLRLSGSSQRPPSPPTVTLSAPTPSSRPAVLHPRAERARANILLDGVNSIHDHLFPSVALSLVACPNPVATQLENPHSAFAWGARPAVLPAPTSERLLHKALLLVVDTLHRKAIYQRVLQRVCRQWVDRPGAPPARPHVPGPLLRVDVSPPPTVLRRDTPSSCHCSGSPNANPFHPSISLAGPMPSTAVFL